jgi:hypothetical protein
MLSCIYSVRQQDRYIYYIKKFVNFLVFNLHNIYLRIDETLLLTLNIEKDKEGENITYTLFLLIIQNSGIRGR